VIDCDGGMHYDPDQGVFVYLGNVRVKDPRFDLSGANDLKIFLDPQKPAGKGDEKSASANVSERMSGEVSRIVATGAVRVLYKDVPPGKQPIEASGALLDYDLKVGQILISGGYPWVVQGAVKMRAGEPNLSLRIDPNQGKFQTSGGDWKTILPLQELRGQPDR
jgi:lipopolysaccharide export system protein LptA